MAKYKVEDIRNIALCGHGSAGKTTLVDALLHKTGTLNRQGSVDDGTSVCDFDEEEKHHKYSIEATVTHFHHAGRRFNMLDTPGYPDFLGQTISTLNGVDNAAIVINAAAGIEVNTRRVFAEAKNVGIGRMIIINKLDSENIDFPVLLDSIKEVFGPECVPLNVPIGLGHKFSGVASTLTPPGGTPDAVIDPAEIHESLIESIVMADEQMMEAYLEGNMPSQEQLSGLLVRSIAEGSLIPIFCTSGKTGTGLAELLDALAMCTLPPTAIARTAKNAAGEDVPVKADPAGPLAAQVFKTRIDPFVQKLSFIRVFSGTLKKDTTVAATGARKGLKIAQLMEVQASETAPVDDAIAGSIVAVVKMEDLHTGMSLGELTMPSLKYPTPMVGLAVTPKSRNDQTKLSGALQKLVEEDPTFRRDLDAQTKETVVTGMSELHLQILQERLKRRDKVEVDTKPPKIPYRETIQANAEGSYRHKKQSGGSGQFAEVHIRMFPLPSGTNIEEYATKEHFPSLKAVHYDEANNFLWIDSIVGGTIPSNFMPAVEKGFRDRLERGVIAGYRVQDVCVEVHFGKDHPVDSNEQAFKTASSMAFRNVFQQARPALLEPIVKIEITVPASKVGDINSDMSSRRGRPLGITSAGGGMQTVIAEVPLAEVMTYNRTLASVTGGQGSYAIEFSHYDVVPPNVQQEIIKAAQLKEEEE